MHRKSLALIGVVTAMTLCLVLTSCTVKPQVSGSYHGMSGASDEAAGNLMLSHPF
jgi:hypothetical protein